MRRAISHWASVGAIALLLVLATYAPLVAAGAESRLLCGSAKNVLAKDTALADAAKAVLAQFAYTQTGDDCVYPLRLLALAKADVLIASGTDPDAACHGCAATLTAYVLQRRNGALSLVRTFKDFVELGTFGTVGTIEKLRIAGNDGFAIESGGTFQGYSYSTADFFAFDKDKLTHFVAKPMLCVTISNEGAVGDASEAVSAEGNWRIDPQSDRRLLVDYKITEKGKTRALQTAWEFAGSSLVLRQGTPPETLGGETCI